MIVDAILGTGFTGSPRGSAAEAITAINDPVAPAVGDRLRCSQRCRRLDRGGGGAGGPGAADRDLPCRQTRPVDRPGKTYAGEVSVIDIGIPVREGVVEPEIGLISDRVSAEIPRRGHGSTKFTAGAVLVCGGSPGLTGAPCMSAMAAMRAGAGYVTASVPRSLSSVFESKLLEVMVVALDDEGGALVPSALEPALARAERVQSVVLGPGLGRDPQSASLVRALAARIEAPLVLDADGLNAFAASEPIVDEDDPGGDAGTPAGIAAISRLASRSGSTVLTPHAGELGRLLGITSAAVDARRLRCVRRAAGAADAIVVLKGDDTLIAEPSGRVAISPGDAPALATAGSGDVLSGIIGAYLAKGMDPFEAACAAVYVHVVAARLVAAELGPEGVIAGDVISALPRVLSARVG